MTFFHGYRSAEKLILPTRAKKTSIFWSIINSFLDQYQIRCANRRFRCMNFLKSFLEVSIVKQYPWLLYFLQAISELYSVRIVADLCQILRLLSSKNWTRVLGLRFGVGSIKFLSLWREECRILAVKRISKNLHENNSLRMRRINSPQPILSQQFFVFNLVKDGHEWKSRRCHKHKRK